MDITSPVSPPNLPDNDDPEIAATADTQTRQDVQTDTDVEAQASIGTSATVERQPLAGSHHTDSSPAAPVVNAPQAAMGGWRGNFDQFMPVLLFLVFYNLVNTELAVLAATAWSVKAAYSRYRRGLRIGWWLPGITLYLMFRAAISIAVERDLIDFGVSSEAVYFGIGIGTKMLIGLAAAVTIVVGRPFAVWAVRWVVELPEAVRTHPRYIATLRNVTWVIVLYEIGSSFWDIWLFNNSGVSLFLITRQVVNFVVAFAAIVATLMYVEHRLSSVVGWPGLVNLLDPSAKRQFESESTDAEEEK